MNASHRRSRPGGRGSLWIIVHVALAAAPLLAADRKPPNVVYVLCDDLGYGDVRCLNPERGKIPTPHLDWVASQGMTFTDAHSGSSVCTPTRYGLLSGRYAWRTRLQRVCNAAWSPATCNGAVARKGRRSRTMSRSTFGKGPRRPSSKLWTKAYTSEE